MSSMVQTGTDETAILTWLREKGFSAGSLDEPMGDVSPRRYYRAELDDGRSLVVATYPPGSRESCSRFEETTRLLATAGVRVPEVVASDCERGLMALEDAGRSTLYDRHPHYCRELMPYLRAAVEAASTISRLDAAAVNAINEPLGEDILKREILQAYELVLVPQELVGDKVQEAALRAALDEMNRLLGASGGTPCHRDLMVRNLIPDGPREVMVLDHQDLRVGPAFYDLASLLNDTIVAPRELEDQILADLTPDGGARLAYHRAAAQRLLKIAGTFEAFSRRGFPHHLPLIHPSLLRALDHLEHLPEMSTLRPWLRRIWEKRLQPDSTQ